MAPTAPLCALADAPPCAGIIHAEPHSGRHSGYVRDLEKLLVHCLGGRAPNWAEPPGGEPREGVARTWRVGGLGREEGGHRDVKILRFHKTFEGLALRVCSAVRGFSLLHFLLQYSL